MSIQQKIQAAKKRVNADSSVTEEQISTIMRIFEEVTVEEPRASTGRGFVGISVELPDVGKSPEGRPFISPEGVSAAEMWVDEMAKAMNKEKSLKELSYEFGITSNKRGVPELIIF